MLKKMLFSLLVTGVIAAAIATPVLAASAPYPDRPIPSDDRPGLFSDNEKSVEPMQCEINLLSKTGLGYILFDADQCSGGLSLGRGHFVEPVVPVVPSEEPITQPPA